MKTAYIVVSLCAITGLMPTMTSYSEVKGDLSTASNITIKENADSVTYAPGICFDSEVIDFGDINTDTIRSHSFVLTNNGTAPLVITKVYSGCGCTTASTTKEPIMPGDTARIVVTFNPAGRSAGYFTKLVRIQSNAASKPHRLYIKGNITRKKER